jgi:hypothetical protein
VPGFRTVLGHDTNKGYGERKGKPRGEADQVFRLVLQVPMDDRTKRYNFRSGQVQLDRILNHVPPDARVYELRGANYQLIIPSGSVLIRYRGSVEFAGQEDLIRLTREIVSGLASQFGVGPDAMAKLLSDLFTISDKWHFDELIGRIETRDARHKF